MNLMKNNVIVFICRFLYLSDDFRWIYKDRAELATGGSLKEKKIQKI